MVSMGLVIVLVVERIEDAKERYLWERERWIIFFVVDFTMFGFVVVSSTFFFLTVLKRWE